MIVGSLAAGSGLIVAKVAADHVATIQVVAAVGGAVLTVGGAGVVVACWPSRLQSELSRLAASAGFFIACIGVVTMTTGAGLFH